MSTITVTPAEYKLLAADVTDVKKVQVRRANGAAYEKDSVGVELVVASELPVVATDGEQLMAGETMLESQVAELGTSGALYGKAVAWCPTVDVLVLP